MADKNEALQSNKTTNRDRFIRIAEKRVNRVLDSIETLGNCSNRKNYEYTEEDVRKIFLEIDRKLRDTKALFQDASRDKKRFRLS